VLSISEMQTIAEVITKVRVDAVERLSGLHAREAYKLADKFEAEPVVAEG
jgi:hypothetical protein